MFSELVNNKGADQPEHLRSLINAFVFRSLENIISSLATSEISIFQLVSVAKETGLSICLFENPKTGFVASRPIKILGLCNAAALFVWVF